MRSYALPRPAMWGGTWRVVYTPNCADGAAIDAQHHAGNGDETCEDVTDYGAALYVSYQDRCDMTFYGRFQRVESADDEPDDLVTMVWEKDRHTGPAQRRNSVKYDDRAPKTYNAALMQSISVALESEWTRHPERWQEVVREREQGQHAAIVQAVADARTTLAAAEDRLKAWEAEHGS